MLNRPERLPASGQGASPKGDEGQMTRSLVAMIVVGALALSTAGCAKGCQQADDKKAPTKAESPAEPSPAPDKPAT